MPTFSVVVPPSLAHSAEVSALSPGEGVGQERNSSLTPLPHHVLYSRLDDNLQSRYAKLNSVA